MFTTSELITQVVNARVCIHRADILGAFEDGECPAITTVGDWYGAYLSEHHETRASERWEDARD